MTPTTPASSGQPIPVSRVSTGGRTQPEYLLEVARECGEIADLGVMRGHRTFLVTGPRLVQEMFEAKGDLYSKRTAPSTRSSRLLLGNGLLASEGDVNQQHRKLMAPVFRRESLMAFADEMVRVVDDLAADWQARGASSFRIDVADAMRDLSQQIIIRTMFGSEYVETTERACAAWRTISDYVGRRFIARRSMPLGVPTPDNLRYQRALAVLNASVTTMVERCASGKESGTLLSVLVAALRTGRMSASDVRDQVTNMFLAGQESVSAALTWTWYLLAQSPDVLARVEAEIGAASPGRGVGFAELHKLAYLEQAIEESLRLYPPGWMIDRLAVAEHTIGGYHIPAGAMVLVSQFASHRLAAYWREPERFDPDRFAASAPAVDGYAYFPWGLGRYVCYGKAFALFELELVLANLARRWRLTLANPTARVELSPGIALRPDRPLEMIVTRRPAP